MIVFLSYMLVTIPTTIIVDYIIKVEDKRDSKNFIYALINIKLIFKRVILTTDLDIKTVSLLHKIMYRRIKFVIMTLK